MGDAIIQGSGDINSVERAQTSVAKNNRRSDKLRSSLMSNQKLKDVSESEFQNKRVRRIQEKKNALNELVKQYNLNTLRLKNDIVNQSNTEQLLKNQNKEIDRNESKLRYLKNDIYTYRKQLEFSENEFKKKSFLIFFLKNIFVFLMITSIIIIMVNNNILNRDLAVKLQLSIACILGVIILINLFLNRNKHNVIFSKQNWDLELPEEKKE